MNRSKNIFTLSACVALIPALTGCGVADFAAEALGPKPDQALVNLAYYAEDNSGGKWPKEVTALLAKHSGELFAEIERVCGVREDGTPPPSCASDNMEPEPTTGLPLDVLIDNAQDAPEESRPLLATQAADLAHAQPSKLAGVNAPVLEGDSPLIEQASKLLEWEYAHVYGLDFARAFVPTEQIPALDEAIASAEERIGQLQAALADAESAPAELPAYTSQGRDMPIDSASAASFVNESLSAEATFWREQLALAMGSSNTSSHIDTVSQFNPEWVKWVAKVAGMTTVH